MLMPAGARTAGGASIWRRTAPSAVTGLCVCVCVYRSLVALDELGRGTATLDGAAIASAVLDHMAHAVGCRGLFATHYHHLSHHHAQVRERTHTHTHTHTERYFTLGSHYYSESSRHVCAYLAPRTHVHMALRVYVCVCLSVSHITGP